jgi:hypothetical protein
MDAASIAGTIHDRLVDLHGQTEPWDDGTSIDDVQLSGNFRVVVTASDGKVYRVTVEPWP